MGKRTQVTQLPSWGGDLSSGEIEAVVQELRRLMGTIDLTGVNGEVADWVASVHGHIASVWAQLHEARERGPIDVWESLTRQGFGLALLASLRSGLDRLERIRRGDGTDEDRDALLLIAAELEKTREEKELPSPSRDQLHEELLPMYEEALKHRAHWQQRCAETAQAVKEYDEALQKGDRLPRAPLPHLSEDPRLPDDGDLMWRYLCLGRALEEVFGNLYAFVPEHVDRDTIYLNRHFDIPFRRYVDRVLVPGGSKAIKAMWLEIRHDLPDEDAGDRAEEGEAPRPSSEEVGADAVSGDQGGDTSTDVYVAIDLAALKLIVGDRHIPLSGRIWDLVRTLADERLSDMPRPRCRDWKNARDMLARRIRAKAGLHFDKVWPDGVLERVDDCYILPATVEIRGGGQIGIRKTC